jgi:hypothetical protein
MGMARRVDRSSVRTFDRDGRLHVAISALTKAGVNEYWGREIPDGAALGLDPHRIYRVLRDPLELQRPETIASFNNLPLLSRHRATSAAEPQKDIVVGSTGTDAAWAAPYIVNSLVCWDGASIAGIETGEQRELSAGYRYRLELTPGTFDGERYDGRMTGILANHIALVDRGRAGSDVVVGDRQPEFADEVAEQGFLRRFPEAARLGNVRGCR